MNRRSFIKGAFVVITGALIQKTPREKRPISTEGPRVLHGKAGKLYVNGALILGLNRGSAMLLDNAGWSVWNGVLTDQEIVSLAKGVSPLLVRPGNLIERS